MVHAPSSQQDWSWLYQRLASGSESVGELEQFLRAGGRPGDMVLATLGNREQEAKPCPRSLEFLLEARVDPNLVDQRLGSPLLHVAGWMSSIPEPASLLLKFKADLELGEQGQPGTPALNTALAAGNAPVALLLLRARANVQWKHEDGATALHVATAWISDAERAGRRMPPCGEEPVEVVSLLMHNGVDPLQREGVKGLTPLDGFRESMKVSPWLRNQVQGKAGTELEEKVRRTFEKVHALMVAAEEAARLKATGNQAFSAGKLEEAMKAWAEGRRLLQRESISGHPLAVLWSNEAMCLKKKGDLEGCRSACEQGLGLFCSEAVRKKLQHNLAESAAGAKAAAEETRPTPSCGEKGSPEAAGAAVAAAAIKQEPKGKESPSEPRQKRKEAAGGLKGGFLKSIGESSKPMYGSKGSVQGKNHSDLVLCPAQGSMHKVPYGKVVPITCPDVEQEEEEEKEDTSVIRDL